MSLVNVVTAGHLYLHFDSYEPRFLLVVPGVPELDAVERLTWQHDELVAIRRLPADWRRLADEGDLHRHLHARLGNRCNGRPNAVARRSGFDGSDYGAWVRDRSLNGVCGCYDLPLFDVDECSIDPDAGVLVTLIETKRPGETRPPAQQKVIDRMLSMGIDYRVEEQML